MSAEDTAEKISNWMFEFYETWKIPALLWGWTFVIAGFLFG